MSMKNSNDTIGNRTRNPPIHSYYMMLLSLAMVHNGSKNVGYLMFHM